MTRSKSKSKVLHVSLWIVQILLSLTLIWSSAMKLFQSPKELSAMWPWAGEVSVGLVKITGIVDLLGALGLILPMLLRIKPIVTVAAALGIILLMVCAAVFHISRGEGSQIMPNVIFASLAAFVAWGRK
jgi:uncharacterized membrane protein